MQANTICRGARASMLVLWLPLLMTACAQSPVDSAAQATTASPQASATPVVSSEYKTADALSAVNDGRCLAYFRQFTDQPDSLPPQGGPDSLAVKSYKKSFDRCRQTLDGLAQYKTADALAAYIDGRYRAFNQLADESKVQGKLKGNPGSATYDEHIGGYLKVINQIFDINEQIFLAARDFNDRFANDKRNADIQAAAINQEFEQQIFITTDLGHGFKDKNFLKALARTELRLKAINADPQLSDKLKEKVRYSLLTIHGIRAENDKNYSMDLRREIETFVHDYPNREDNAELKAVLREHWPDSSGK